jgi:hypothetical protein
MQQMLWIYKEERGCYKCGEKHPRVLNFHHRNPKDKNFNIHDGKNSLTKVMSEVKKCDILCINCHVKYFTEHKVKNLDKDIIELTELMKKESDKKTKNKLLKKRQNFEAKRYAYQYKLSHPCSKCGENDEKSLLFHHRNPEEKDNKVTQLYKYGIKKVREEIEKCDVLCHNCHIKLHRGL